MDDITRIYLNTDVGYVEFNPRELEFAADGRSVVQGSRSRPAEASDTSQDLLTLACG